jgi:ABC-type glycerol-3-phosphate transport system permease component
MPSSTQATIRSSRRRSSKGRAHRVIGVARYVVLGLIAIAFLFPLWWMVVGGFKTPGELFGSSYSLLPKRWTLDNYRLAFEAMPLLRNIFNSIFIAGGYTVLALLFTSLGGYAFAKLEFPGRDALFVVLLATMMVPGFVTLVPSFVVVSRLGWVNSYWGAILPGTAHAFGIFLMRQYIKGVPDELLEAARIDGAGPFAIYWRIILPVSKPALATVAIIDFIGSWNDFLWPLIILRTKEMFTLVLAITNLPASRGFNTPWGAVMAGSTIAVIPLITLFLVLQKQYVAGLTAGAVKG